MPLGRIPLDHQVAAIDVAQSPQFSKEQTRSVVAAVLLDQLGGHDRADDGDPAALHWLRTSGEGPSQHRAAKNGDNLASLHSGDPWVEKMLSHCARAPIGARGSYPLLGSRPGPGSAEISLSSRLSGY